MSSDAQIAQIAHAHGIPVMVDGAQSAPHFKVDVQAIDCDFFAFSGHKMYGPTGIGVLYGKEEWLEKLPPYQGGGEMIDKVTWEKTTFERLPFKFEAGTPDYIATHGLAKAIDYIESLGFDAILQHEQELTRYCMEQLMTIPNMHIYGPNLTIGTVPSVRDAVVSFNVGSIHHLDMGTLLDRLGIAVRTGHHCAQPLMDRGKIEAGCDEAGRGCLAGSVYAAAVILPDDYQNDLLNDSKQLTEKRRYQLREIIERDAVAWAVGIVTPEEIDKINILNASILAMHRALDQLKVRPEAIIVDGNRFKPYNNIPHTTIVKGDGKYLSIAAASILAKTYRDDYMNQLAEEYPQYDWLSNKGYPTKKHRDAIRQYGITPYHRKSYNLLGDGQLSLDFGD